MLGKLSLLDCCAVSVPFWLRGGARLSISGQCLRCCLLSYSPLSPLVGGAAPYHHPVPDEPPSSHDRPPLRATRLRPPPCNHMVTRFSSFQIWARSCSVLPEQGARFRFGYCWPPKPLSTTLLLRQHSPPLLRVWTGTTP